MTISPSKKRINKTSSPKWHASMPACSQSEDAASPRLEELPQPGLQAHFGGAFGIGIQPLLEILDEHLMLDLRLFDPDHKQRATVPDFIHPVIFPEDAQGLSHRFEKAGRRHFDRMFDVGQVAA